MMPHLFPRLLLPAGMMLFGFLLWGFLGMFEAAVGFGWGGLGGAIFGAIGGKALNSMLFQGGY